MRTFRDLIDALCAPALAERLGLDESHVRTMRARNSIPPEYWAAVVEMAHDLGHGLSHEALLTMRAERFPRAERVEAAE